MRLLLIDGNSSVSRLANRLARDEGFDVDVAPTAASAIERLAAILYDAIILDPVLPDADGLSLLGDLRARGDRTPVMIVSARVAVHERLAGFHAGADDYLLRPFAFVELVTRIWVLLRRRTDPASPSRSLSNVSIDATGHLIAVGGESDCRQRQSCDPASLTGPGSRARSRDATRSRRPSQ